MLGLYFLKKNIKYFLFLNKTTITQSPAAKAVVKIVQIVSPAGSCGVIVTITRPQSIRKNCNSWLLWKRLRVACLSRFCPEAYYLLPFGDIYAVWPTPRTHVRACRGLSCVWPGLGSCGAYLRSSVAPERQLSE